MIGPSLQERHRSKTPVRNLTLHIKSQQLKHRHSELRHPKEQSPKTNKTAMPKAKSKTGTEDEDIHGVINPGEAKAHVEAIESLIMKLDEQ